MSLSDVAAKHRKLALRAKEIWESGHLSGLTSQMIDESIGQTQKLEDINQLRRALKTAPGATNRIWERVLVAVSLFMLPLILAFSTQTSPVLSLILSTILLVKGRGKKMRGKPERLPLKIFGVALLISGLSRITAQVYTLSPVIKELILAFLFE